MTKQEPTTDARALHGHVLTLDLHTHALLQAQVFGRDLAVAHRPCRVFRPFASTLDLPRMREGGLDALFLTLYWPGSPFFPGSRARHERMIDRVEQIVAADPGWALCRTSAEVRAAKAAGRVAALLGIEGAHCLEGDPDAVDTFAARGVRLMQLTHFVANGIADGTEGLRHPHGGLTPLGVEVVRRMNATGMVVDAAHMTDQGIRHLARVCRAPFVSSHTGVRGLRDRPRNLSDASIDAIAASGGLVGIVLFPPYLAAGTSCGADRVIDHIAYVADRVGIAHVGIGSDTDGPTWLPTDMRDVRDYPALTRRMRARGFSDDDIAAVWGGNALRVLDAAQQAATLPGNH